MDHTTVRARIHRDNTGTLIEIPVIITEAGPIQPLLEFLLEMAHVRSFTWMQKMTQGVGLLLDYMAANHNCFEDPKILFQTFVQRLYTGTIGEDGLDPSGLFWIPKSTAIVRQLTNQLSTFSDWMANRMGTAPLNPWRNATRYEEMLNWAAYHQKHGRSFLGHTWSREHASETAKRAKIVLLKRNQTIDHTGVKFFPDDRIMDLLFKGFIVPGRQHSRRPEERLNLRDILITLLMHFGGVRVSEPFHIYVHDVQPDPLHPERAMVRIYHPSEGLAPSDWHESKRSVIQPNREAYLRGKYSMRPRDQYYKTNQWHAGWKGNLLDSKSKYMHIHWFPMWSGELFLKLWNLYLIPRSLKSCAHPFAFVTEEGHPHSVDSFCRAHARACERIGLTPAKMLGTTPHGHRHAYGQRMTDAKIAPLYRKKALHHKSLESQLVYTEPQIKTITQILDNATTALNADKKLRSPDFLSYGFEDVDPMGLLSGLNPKLRRS